MVIYWPTNDYILNIMIICSVLVLGVILLAWFIAWLSDDDHIELTEIKDDLLFFKYIPPKTIGKVTDSYLQYKGLTTKAVVWDVPLKEAMKKNNDDIFNCPCSFVGTGGWTIQEKEFSKLVHFSQVIHHTKEQNDILNGRLIEYKKWCFDCHNGKAMFKTVLLPGPAILSPTYARADLNTYFVYSGAWNDFKLIPKWAAKEVTGFMYDPNHGAVMPKFDGRVTIRVKFRNKAEYQKFRKYVLKTDWSYDFGHPQYECYTREFHTCDDLAEINKEIIRLLQLGFDVWTCNYQLTDVDPAELESPSEDDDFCDLEDPEEWS